ncbi:piggyBac transposable element-derived protein 4-like [Osmerus eperlanus]|uniref:piggyBac transposable element-derived protein 4-like n=1 Tax=Osmerus eperlanus TaxID=29151 RepID=UPI002E12F18C
MPQSVPTKPLKGLDLLQNINEMDSEGEQCGELEGEDDRDDGDDSDSGSETDSEVECPGDSWWRDTARDGTVWVEQTVSRGRVGEEGGAMKEAPGPTSYAKENIESPLSSFLCLIDTEMWQKIRQYTEAEAERKSETFKVSDEEVKAFKVSDEEVKAFKVSDEELKAFVGLVYLRGIMGGTSVKVDDYWSADLGNPLFKDTMSRQKFRDIMRYLRFDDKNTRADRLVTDRFAMMSEIFDNFVKNSIACYTPGENITIDEQLLPTKARCRFTQYMANKQDKFGIKFWVAADASTKYMLNARPYLGRDDSVAAGPRFSDSVVMSLVEPFLGKGRNVTTHNFFPSLALANNLLAKKTTVVGTAKKSIKGMPRCAQAHSERFSTKVLKAGKVSLTVYQAKPKTNVCILSTMHQTVLTDDGAKKLPNTLSHYKSTKAGVNVMDQMARQYSVRGGSHRWPVAVFYNILDLAAINAHILYTQSMNVRISRRKFILRLVKELCAPQKWSKAEEARRRLLPESPFQPVKRRRCQVNKCSGNKTFEICQGCKRLVCGKCTKNAPKLCLEC